MGSYVEIDELKTWYDELGAGEPLLLLHGGISTNETWGAQMPDFGAHFRVIAPERRGHGHTPDLEGPLSYDVMASDTIGFLEAVVGDPAHLVGWSDGGVVGLLVAMARPDLVRKLVVISANFDTSGLVPQWLEGLTSMTAGSDDLAMFARRTRRFRRTVPSIGRSCSPSSKTGFLLSRTSPSSSWVGSAHLPLCSPATTT